MTDKSITAVPLIVLDGGGTHDNPACDICGNHGGGTLVAASDVRHAVLVKGFNPFESAPELVRKAAGSDSAANYRRFRLLVRYDGSDWNICAECMAAMADSLPKRLKPARRGASAFTADLSGFAPVAEGGKA